MYNLKNNQKNVYKLILYIDILFNIPKLKHISY